MGELIDFLGEILQWFLDACLWVFHTLYELVLVGLAAVVDAIPVPAWLVGADPFSALDPGIVWFLEALELPAGIGIILGAYAIRFLIRRIPVIG